MVPLGVSLGPRTAQPAPRPAVAEDPATAPHDAGVLVLAGPCGARHASIPAGQGQGRCGVPDQAAARRRADPGRPAGWYRVPGGGGRLLLWRQPGFTEALGAAKVRFVLALKPRKGTWAPAEAAHAPVEATGELGWQGPRKPDQWRRFRRRFRDGHTDAWWAADARLAGWGPDWRLRLVVANLARPASRRAQRADLAEVVRLYGLRNWVEQGYKQVKGKLGWRPSGARARWPCGRCWPG